MKFDDLFTHMGGMGSYQICITVVVFLISMFAIESLTMIFVGGDMPHWCLVPELANLSYARQRLIAIPWEDENDPESFDSCEMYDMKYGNISYEDLIRWNRSTVDLDGMGIIKCPDGWVYEQSTFISTIVSRFDLVCGKSYLNQMISTIYMAGVLIGVATSGAISDRIGRLSTIMIGLVVRVVGYALAFPAVNIAMLIIGRFIIGLGQSAVFLAGFVLASELIGPRFRTMVGVGIQIAFSIGFALQALIAYAVRDDVLYQVAALSPVVFFFSIVLFIPESPRWLAVNGKTERAQKVIDDICAGNGTKLPDGMRISDLEKEVDDDVPKKECSALLRSPKMRMRTLIMDFSWFTCSLVYYALSLNTGTLAGDIYVNTFISAVVEIPANIVCIFLLDWKYLGRRGTLSGSFFVAGLASFIGVPLTIFNQETAATAMSMIGKAFVTMSFSVVYIFSSELFPTEVRHVGIGTASMCARVAAMIAPYMGAPLIDVWEPLPSVIFGSVATLAGILGLFLPETLGLPLLDTIEQAEAFDGKHYEASKSSDDQNAESKPEHYTKTHENGIMFTDASNGHTNRAMNDEDAEETDLSVHL